MVVTGIVAEYNPFHNGHKYMIEKARENGATHVIAVMSGAVVQRGDIAVFDKHFRAKKAVENGVDLVLELPFPFSCSSGEIFARSAVEMLAGLGENVVNSLAFGCECDNLDLLKKAAQASNDLKDNYMIKQKISDGKNYPAAVCETVYEIFGEPIGNIFRSANNILAVEYIKWAERFMPNAEYIPIKRKSVEHDSLDITDSIASASAIRQLIKKGADVSGLCPYGILSQPIYTIKNMERGVLFRLNCMNKTDFTNLPDCSEDIADRILTVLSEGHVTLEQFFEKCKSKNITMARLRRIIMYAVLRAKKSDLCSPCFVRILAFNRKGAEILSKCRNSILPVDTSLKALENTSSEAKRIIRLENNGVAFQQACINGEYKPINEYRKKIEITN